MTLLVNASLKCNMRYETGSFCKYCYNRANRANKSSPQQEVVDLEAIKRRIRVVKEENLTSTICLHGGEPLSWGFLEELLAQASKVFNGCSIQTNGLMINEEHIQLFKKYDVSVGVSLDGHGDLNRYRCGKEATEQIMENLKTLVEKDIPTSVISVISTANGLPEQREAFKRFLKKIDALGINGRLNPCTHPNENIQLTPEQARDFYMEIGRFVMEQGMYGWSPFADMIHQLKGEEGACCIFNNCDPYGTAGGITLNNRGELSRCHKFEREYLMNDLKNTKIRKELLRRTDCKNCPYFPLCNGGCCADARNFDWRNKTRWCTAWRPLWEYLHNCLKTMGVQVKIPQPEGKQQTRRERKHGDRPHGDQHGDHYDA